MAFFEDLDIWRNAKILTLTTYREFQFGHDFGFKDQIQRASVSIMNNIAEGSESGSVTNYIHFLNIAKGSCAEVRSMSLNKLINFLNSRK